MLGTKNQTSDQSWWPKESTWKAGSLDIGSWTKWNEEWFQLCLQDILSTSAQPRSSIGQNGSWKANLKIQKGAKALARQMEDNTREWLYNNRARDLADLL